MDCQVDNINLTKEEPKGGTSKSYTIRRLAKENRQILDLLDRVVENNQGERNDFVNNINEVEERPTSNTKAAALRRLRDHVRLSPAESAKDVDALGMPENAGNQYTVVDKNENVNKHKGGNSAS
jgi:hypothetical protein